MAVVQRMSEADYEQFVLSGAEGLWELHDGVLVEKPGMSWVRQPGGSYQETVYRGGVIALAALPGVAIDLDRLFAV